MRSNRLTEQWYDRGSLSTTNRGKLRNIAMGEAFMSQIGNNLLSGSCERKNLRQMANMPRDEESLENIQKDVNSFRTIKRL